MLDFIFSKNPEKVLQMSSNLAVKVNGLDKLYQIYEKPQDRLKQSLQSQIKRLFGGQKKEYYKEFWALKDVSFEIKKGQTVGIIGRNGSGKSTLLQIICGILSPTHGHVYTSGRIAALLELGSGFNLEFTGRENVYLNASLLGLSRQEIDNQFDEIVAFADIGDFVDQPVKMYSSGMFVRLAFAVIAHVDADILVVDEALAVGDAAFTQKCMQYIRAFQKRGTLIFVSHDTAAVQNLCETCIWLDHGNLQLIGPSKMVAEAYLKSTLQKVYGEEVSLEPINKINDKEKFNENIEINNNITSQVLLDYGAKALVKNNFEEATGWKTGAAELISVKISLSDDTHKDLFMGGEEVKVTVTARAKQNLPNPILGFTLRDRLGQELFGENTLVVTDIKPIEVLEGKFFSAEFTFTLPMLPNGQYSLMASVANGTLYDAIQHHFLHNALIITVQSSKVRWGLVGIQFKNVYLKILEE